MHACTHVRMYTQVSVVKAKITDEIAMPASKQKLQIGVSCDCTQEALQSTELCGCAQEALQSTELCEGPNGIWEIHCMYV